MRERGGPSREDRNRETRSRTAELLRLRISGDIPGIVRLFAEDVELGYNCWKADFFPAGEWRGRDALRENLRRIEVDYELLDAEILSILVDGNRSAARWIGHWRYRATGDIYPMDMAYFLRWRNGLVDEMIKFIDHHCDSRAMEPSRDFENLLSQGNPGLEREEIARRLIDLGNFSTQGPDVALFRRLCSPDVICEFVGKKSSIAYAGRHRGIEALVNIIRSNSVEFEQLGHAAPEVVIEGRDAVVRRSVEWRHRGTGRRGLVELADFVRFENGLIVEMIEFRDSVALFQGLD